MLKQVLEKLGADVSRYPDLRKSIEEIIDKDVEPLEYWKPFKLSLDPSQTMRIRESSLAGLAKLFAHDIDFTGKGSDLDLALEKLTTVVFSISSIYDEILIKEATLLDEIIVTVITAIQNSVSNSAEESVQLQGIKLLLTILTSSKTNVHERSLICVLKVCFNIYAQSAKNSTNEVTSKAALTQMINFVFARMERSRKDSPEDVEHFNILLRDSMLVLKFLSFMATFTDGQSAAQTFNPSQVVTAPLSELSTQATKFRLLALELLVSVLNNAGPVLVTDTNFSQIIQQNLCLAISQNSIATNPALFELSLSVFLLLIRHFRHLLKLEIEVLLNTVFLQILEMGNSTFQQRNIVLQGLGKICANPQTLLDIYYNYDCDFQMTSLYEKIMGIASRIAQGRSEAVITKTSGGILGFGSDSKGELAKDQDRKLRLRALSVLTSILTSLVTFSKEKQDETEDSTDVVVISAKNPLESINMNKVANRKQLFNNGVKLFNSKPNKGMKFLIENDFVENNYEAISNFLRSTPQLDKSSIGDFIGDSDPENIKIMRTFIDQLDFSGLDFVEALRLFLQNFRLPGEAQKIDRLMEKFADRYCENNPTIFAKADTAYTLAFSVIMLNTDQHSSQIKHRMDKAAFIKNNRGINDEGDLPEEFLSAIFDEINQNEIVMEDEGELAKITMGWGAGYINERQRMEMYKKEVVTIQKKSQMLMATGSSNRVITPFMSATSKDLVRPMFALSSWAIMAALSLQFEAISGEEPEVKGETAISEICLTGFSAAINLACMYKLETERDAFVTSLAKLTSLSDFYTLTSKNIKAIATMVETSLQLGEHLQKGWIHTLRTISQLEYMQQEVASHNQLKATGGRRPSHDHREISRSLDEFVKDLQSQKTLIAIDRIFTNSKQLTGTSILDFFNAICSVSLEEVGLDEHGKAVTMNHKPRIYLLQKIVEVAYYNISRIRFEWTQIWRILQPHFNTVACHSDQTVATFAVDALRQLGTKLLEREELGHFSSQNEFLKSFEWIIKHTSSSITRELIINSIMQIVTARATSIRSGWRSIFSALLKAAQTDEKMAHQSFSIIQNVFKNHMQHLVISNVFVDLVSCLAEFALIHGSGPAHDEQVMGSIQLLQSCTKSLMQRAEDESVAQLKRSEKPKTSGTTAPSALMMASPHSSRVGSTPAQPYLTEDGCISEEHFYLSWFPILSAFSRVITESESVLVRTHTMETLFETFRTAGHLFDKAYWKAIQRNVIAPIFDDLNEAVDPKSQEASAAILILGLRLLVDLISIHFDLLVKSSPESTPDFLEKSLDRMVNLLGSEDEKLASTGQICLQQFLVNNAQKLCKLDSRKWLIQRIVKGFQFTLPKELVNCQTDAPITPTTGHLTDVLAIAQSAAQSLGEPLTLETINFEKTVLKCVTHLEFIQSVRDFALVSVDEDGVSVISHLPKEEQEEILECIFASYSMARSFNHNLGLRHAIYRRGWVSQLPNLVRQESMSLQVYLSLLFSINKDVGDEECLKSLVEECVDILERCLEYLQDTQKYSRDLIAWGPTLVLIFKEAAKIKPENKLDKYLAKFYIYATKLMLIDQLNVKQAIQEFFQKVGDRFFKGDEWIK